MVAYAGIFDTEDKAQAAKGRLTTEGFKVEGVLMLAASDPGAQAAIADPKNADFVDGISSRLGDAVKAGRSVVIVKIPLGSGLRGMSVLEEAGPEKILTAGVKTTNFLSDAFGLPLLVKRKNKQTIGGTILGPTTHITGGLLTGSTTHITGSDGLTTKSTYHITGNLLTDDKTHFAGAFPLVSGTRKSSK